MNKLITNVLIFIFLGAFIVALLIVPMNSQTQNYIKYIPVYSKVQASRNELNGNINNIEAMQSQIRDIKTQLTELSKKPVQKKYGKNDVNWKLDIPNLLIYLDSGATKCKVALEINYDKAKQLSQLDTNNQAAIDQGAGNQVAGQVQNQTNTVPNTAGQTQTQASQGQQNQSQANQPQVNQPQVNQPQVNQPQEQNGQQTQNNNEQQNMQVANGQTNTAVAQNGSSTNNLNTTTGNNAQNQTNTVNQPNNATTLNLVEPSGFKNYVLPITVRGDYMNIVAFIKYCTKTTFIVPYSIHMNFDTKANKVKADLVLRVLYLAE